MKAITEKFKRTTFDAHTTRPLALKSLILLLSRVDDDPAWAIGAYSGTEFWTTDTEGTVVDVLPVKWAYIHER